MTNRFCLMQMILPDEATLKNAVILMTPVIKDNGKFYTQQFLE